MAYVARKNSQGEWWVGHAHAELDPDLLESDSLFGFWSTHQAESEEHAMWMCHVLNGGSVQYYQFRKMLDGAEMWENDAALALRMKEADDA